MIRSRSEVPCREGASQRGVSCRPDCGAGIAIATTASITPAAAINDTLRLELYDQPVRIIEIAPGMVRTDEFAVKRFRGDAEKAAAVYAGVAEPLTADDVADTVAWAVTRPSHVNVDLLVLRPRAQAAQYKVYRTPS